MFLVLVVKSLIVGCEVPRLLQHVRISLLCIQSYLSVYITSIVNLCGLSFGIAALLFSVTRRLSWCVETARQFFASLQEERPGSQKDALSGKSEI